MASMLIVRHDTFLCAGDSTDNPSFHSTSMHLRHLLTVQTDNRHSETIGAYHRLPDTMQAASYQLDVRRYI